MIKFATCLLVIVTFASSQKISVPVQYLQCNGGSQPEPSEELRGIPGQRGEKGETGVPCNTSTYEEYEEQSRIFSNRLKSLRKQFTSATDENVEIGLEWNQTKVETNGEFGLVRKNSKELLDNFQKFTSDFDTLKEKLRKVRTTVQHTAGNLRMMLDFQHSVHLRLQNLSREEPSTIKEAFTKVRTCKDVPRVYGQRVDGRYAIQPSDDLPPFTASCVFGGEMPGYDGSQGNIFFVSSNGAATLVNHNSEDEFLVEGFDKPKSYKRSIRYEASIAQIRALIDYAKNCRQYIKYQCVASPLTLYRRVTDEDRYAGWDNWNGTTRHYWGDSNGQDSYCSCGAQKTCRYSWLRCNCDSMKDETLSDEGYLDQPHDLPVTKLYFGNLEESWSSVTSTGLHTLGPLQCLEY